MRETGLCKTGQIEQAQPCIVFGTVTIECCPYCEQPATMTIPSNPGHVCVDHTLEFWTSLMAYVKERGDQCEKQVRPCTCKACVALGAAYERAKAIAAAGPPPRDREIVPVRRAS